MPDTFIPFHGIKASGIVLETISVFDAILAVFIMRDVLWVLLINKLFYACLNISPQAAPLFGGNDGLVLARF